MESIAGMQSRRMDEQRASLPQLPGLNNQQVILQRLSVAASDSTPLPDDNFFDMLMRCQVGQQKNNDQLYSWQNTVFSMNLLAFSGYHFSSKFL